MLKKWSRPQRRRKSGRRGPVNRRPGDNRPSRGPRQDQVARTRRTLAGPLTAAATLNSTVGIMAIVTGQPWWAAGAIMVLAATGAGAVREYLRRR